MGAREVKEIEGLYGPFTLSERVLQKIWWRGDFAHDGLRALSGRAVEILDPGRWNALEGPDFRGARLRIDGRPVHGDVEVHFETGGWREHGHERDPAFDGVALHVVLYAPGEGQASAVTSSGRIPETVALLPRLSRDLESHATDEALLELERMDELTWVERFLGMPVAQRADVLRGLALERWSAKRAFARRRLAHSGWPTACHQMALEGLGYRRNRAPMHRLAAAWPLERLRREAPEAETLYEAERDAWRLSGIRPANHPRERLASYLALVRRAPDWPEALRDCWRRAEPGSAEASAEAPSRAARRALGLRELRRAAVEAAPLPSVGATRFNTLMSDALLPLAGAEGLLSAESVWYHWWSGDVPEAARRFLRRSEVVDGRRQPHCNGLNQGALALFFSGGEPLAR